MTNEAPQELINVLVKNGIIRMDYSGKVVLDVKDGKLNSVILHHNLSNHRPFIEKEELTGDK